MANVAISGDTSGAVTLFAPAVSGTTTLTLPTANGTILTTGSPQSGGVIQVVQSAYASLTTTTSTTLSATGLSASITPKFSTSKIMIFVSMNGCYIANSTNAFHFELYKNGSSISYLEDIMGYLLVGNLNSSYQYLDSPATTSATTYAIYWKSTSGGSIQINNYYGANTRTVSGITLMEIAA